MKEKGRFKPTECSFFNMITEHEICINTSEDTSD